MMSYHIVNWHRFGLIKIRRKLQCTSQRMGLSFLPITLTNVDIPFDKEVRVSLFDQAVPAECCIRLGFN